MAIGQCFACNVELGMGRWSAPIHLNTSSGDRCGVGRTARTSTTISDPWWKLISGLMLA